MMSLDKFIIRVYRRIYKGTDFTEVNAKDIIMYLSKADDADVVYLASVMMQFHPEMYATKIKAVKNNDLRDLLHRCIVTPYYSRKIKACNENLELFNRLVRESRKETVQ